MNGRTTLRMAMTAADRRLVFSSSCNSCDKWGGKEVPVWCLESKRLKDDGENER